MPDSLRIIAPLFLLAQALLIHWAAGSEQRPSPPDLTRFPSELGAWMLLREDPIAADVALELGADRTLSRTYLDRADTTTVNLFAAWFQSQSTGARQPHSPKVCLPGSGWTPTATDEVALDTSAGVIRVNRYIVDKGSQRAVVLYWFQTPHRVIAGEWSAKLWLVPDALRYKRTDTALVRVIAWVMGGRDDLAFAHASDFARKIYPELRTEFPQ